MKTIFTSVIIPTLTQNEPITEALDCLLEQAGNFEIIVVNGSQAVPPLTALPEQIRMISSSGTTRGTLLNEGTAIARGDVFLFLWPNSQLPPDALLAIERNLKLLSQTIGGNFHVKFDDDSLLAKLLAYFLKQWRYRGHYYGNSGIFIRAEVFQAIGGFRPYSILEDYDFARRMEKYGPTLYLPDTVIVSAQNFKHKKLKTILFWLTAQTLFAFGLHSKKLARLGLEM